VPKHLSVYMKNIHKKTRQHFILASFLIGLVVLTGFGCKEKPEDNNSNKSEKRGNEMTYDYKDIKQVIGDMDLASEMSNKEATVDNTAKKVNGVDRGIMMMKDGYTYSGLIKDVVGGKASGLAEAKYEDSIYSLYVNFANLLEPVNGDFYEGWLVRKDPFDYISTGKVEKIGGIYSNLYKSKKNLVDYNIYVLTLEPDDGDPDPAKHILEGALKSNP